MEDNDKVPSCSWCEEKFPAIGNVLQPYVCDRCRSSQGSIKFGPESSESLRVNASLTRRLRKAEMAKCELEGEALQYRNEIAALRRKLQEERIAFNRSTTNYALVEKLEQERDEALKALSDERRANEELRAGHEALAGLAPEEEEGVPLSISGRIGWWNRSRNRTIDRFIARTNDERAAFDRARELLKKALEVLGG